MTLQKEQFMMISTRGSTLSYKSIETNFSSIFLRLWREGGRVEYVIETASKGEENPAGYGSSI